MGFFDGKDKKKTEAEKAERERIEKLKKLMEREQLSVPRKERVVARPREYTEFLKEVRQKPQTFFERIAVKAERIGIKPSEKTERSLQKDIEDSYMVTSARGVYALSIAVLLVLMVFSFAYLASGYIIQPAPTKENAAALVAEFEELVKSVRAPTAEAREKLDFAKQTLQSAKQALEDKRYERAVQYSWDGKALLGSTGKPDFLGFFLFFLASIFAWYFTLTYPAARSRVLTMKMGSDSILCVLYMIIYMRGSPNLEGALKFASENLRGPLSWDLKKLLWGINLGTYTGADSALGEYLERWKERNPPFSEALNLLRGSAVQAERREELFNETLSVILDGTRERAKRFIGNLRMPIMLIHAMGILLPVMGLVLFPIVVIFLAKSIKPEYLFIMYDIALPAFLWVIINKTLEAQPSTFSQPDISLAKGVPQLGKFFLSGKEKPVWPVALAVFLPLFLLGMYALLTSGVETSLSLALPLSFGLGAAVYGILDSYQKTKVRQDIRRIEEEFSIALFQLGNQLSTGVPIESAMSRSVEGLKGMRVADLFTTTTANMTKFGYTFERAMFDKDVGSVWYYPSALIRSVLSVIAEASKKGMQTASIAMVTISRYLKGLHTLKEDLEEILGDTISSMKFLSVFLAPLVAGITVTMAMVIIQILTQFGVQYNDILNTGAQVSSPQQLLILPWCQGAGGCTVPITAGAFQMVVGLYMIETVALLAYFLNRLQNGEDEIGLRETMGTTLIFGIIVYIMSWGISSLVFGSTIAPLLVPIGGK